MSTKIYNGIKFKSNNLHEVLTQLQSLKEEDLNIGMAHLSENEMFSFILFNDLHEKNVWDIRQMFVEALCKPVRSLMEPSLLFSVIVFPHKNGGLYGYYLDDNVRGYSKLLMDSGFVEDYHYQNQTDQPEDITDEEWEKRGDLWDELLPGIGILRDNGFIYKIVNDSDVGFNITPIIKESVERVLEHKANFEIAKKLLDVINSDEKFIERLGGEKERVSCSVDTVDDKVHYIFRAGFFGGTKVKISKDEMIKIVKSKKSINNKAEELKPVLTGEKQLHDDDEF